MKSRIESCIASKNPGMRSNDELVELLPWFRRYGKNVLKDATDEVLIEILQKCIYHRFIRDKVIIAEGDTGKNFFILIEGQVSIYIQDREGSTDESKRKRLSMHGSDIRSTLGTCVLVEGEGYSFGEYALMDEKGVRKASVIADDDCSLIAIDMNTYNNNLKDLQADILLDIERFINKNVLFRDFNINIKELIKMSIKKVSVSFNTNLITQGQDYGGLMFIISGSGHLTIDVSKHEIQYPDMFPLDFAVYDKMYKEFPELKPVIKRADRSEAECVEDLNPKYIRIKRTKNYAELERYISNQKKHICAVQSGEIIGDFELLFDLKTNLSSITCIEKMEAYILESVHIDRLFKRMDPKLLFDRLKDVIRPKLIYREKYFQEIPIPLMSFLKTKLYDKKIELVKVFPKIKTDKRLPNYEEEWRHLLQMYGENKAPIFLPCTRNSVFLKDLMRQNASRRKRLKKIEIEENKENIEFIVNKVESFPINQECIYRLQRMARDPVNFIELIYQEIHKQEMRKPKLPYPMVSRITTKLSLGDQNTEPLQTNLSGQATLLFPGFERHEEDNQTKRSRVKANDIARLQKSQIEFLNSLCSEKSRYEIKVDSRKKPNSDGIRTHFLPSLEPKTNVLQGNFQARKHVRTRR